MPYAGREGREREGLQESPAIIAKSKDLCFECRWRRLRLAKVKRCHAT